MCGNNLRIFTVKYMGLPFFAIPIERFRPLSFRLYISYYMYIVQYGIFVVLFKRKTDKIIFRHSYNLI